MTEPRNEDATRREEVIYEFGPFRIRTDDRLLLRDGAPVRVPPKAIDLLLALIESGGPVGKADLFKKVWVDTAVTDSSLTFQIHVLRDALGDTASTPKYIETIPRRGYRFIGDVTAVPVHQLKHAPIAAVSPTDPAGAHSAEPPDAVPAPATGAPVATADDVHLSSQAWHAAPAVRWLAIAVSAALLALILGMVLPRPSVPSVARVTRLTTDGRVHFGRLPTDGQFLVFDAASGQQRIRTDRTIGAPEPVSDGFYLLDLSPRRREGLAVRPGDRGAENGLWIVPFDGQRPRRIGMTLASGAAWSHDGRWIAYTHQRALFVVDPDTVQVRQVATFASEPAWLGWSPDDRRIRFTLSALVDRANLRTLWDVDVASGRSWRVLEQPQDLECCGGWLPNGRDYVFSRGRGEDSQIWLLRQGGGVLRRRSLLQPLTSGSLSFLVARPSIDGSRVFAIGSAPPQLVRYDLQTRTFAPYLGGLSALNVEFSRDGQEVIYITHPDLTLWVARADGTHARRLSSSPMEVDAASRSPDGRWIAFRGRSRGSRTKIYVMPSAGGPAEPLVAGDVEQGRPSWSPDSTEIAFGDVPETFGRPTGSEVIQVYNRTTRSFSVLAGSRLLWNSQWSPDGRFVAALTATSDQTLMLHDRSTGGWRSLGVEHVGAIAWSRDGRYIYCDQEGPDLWTRRVRVADGHVERLVELGALQAGHGAGLALDGAPLFRIAHTDIYALELEYR